MKLLIINGPNLNLLGKREPEIYGSTTFEEYLNTLQRRYCDVKINYFQSNVEGEIINELQQAEGVYSGVILNAGGYTHTSVAIADAVAFLNIPVIEVHISLLPAREPFRHTSLIAPKCSGSIMGFGLDSYRLAVESFLK